MHVVLQQLVSAREQWFVASGEHGQKLLGLGHTMLSLEASRFALLPVDFDAPSCIERAFAGLLLHSKGFMASGSSSVFKLHKKRIAREQRSGALGIKTHVCRDGHAWRNGNLERDVYRDCGPIIHTLIQHTTEMYGADAVVSPVPLGAEGTPL